MSEVRVYFLRPAGEQGPIKIGSSREPASRLRTYQIWSPVMLEIVTTCAAHPNTERFLHRHFIADYMHGEWFRWSAGLQAVMDHITSHGSLPDWVIEGTPNNWREFRRFIEKYPKGKSRRAAA